MWGLSCHARGWETAPAWCMSSITSHPARNCRPVQALSNGGVPLNRPPNQGRVVALLLAQHSPTKVLSPFPQGELPGSALMCTPTSGCSSLLFSSSQQSPSKHQIKRCLWTGVRGRFWGSGGLGRGWLSACQCLSQKSVGTPFSCRVKDGSHPTSPHTPPKCDLHIPSPSQPQSHSAGGGGRVGRGDNTHPPCLHGFSGV